MALGDGASRDRMKVMREKERLNGEASLERDKIEKGRRSVEERERERDK